MKAFNYQRLAVASICSALFAGCAGSPQDQFGYAVSTGNINLAQQTVATNYANMRVYRTPTQYSVPMQFAIARNDTRMAGFLLDHGAHHSLDGKNLAYYSAENGHMQMAKFFASRGIGDGLDVSRGQLAAADNQRQQAEANKRGAQVAGLIALGAIAAMANSGGGSGDFNRNSNGFTEEEVRQQNSAEWEYMKQTYGN